MPDDQPQSNKPKARPRFIDVTKGAKALVITGQSKPPDDAKPDAHKPDVKQAERR